MTGRSRVDTSLRRIAIVILALLALGALAACGGDDGGGGGGSSGDYPKFSGAKQLGAVELTQADLEDMESDVTDAKAAVLRTDKPFDEVAEYYGEGVEDDGWLVAQDIELDDEQQVFIVSNDKRVAAVYVMSGAVAKESEDLFANEGLEIDLEEIADEDTVILVTHFTCQERSVASCLTELAP